MAPGEVIGDPLLYQIFIGLQLPVGPEVYEPKHREDRKEGDTGAFNRPFSFQPAIMDKH